MSDPDPAATRPVHFAELGGFVATGVFRWPDLAPGARIAGPAVVQASDTTVVVPPEHVATVDVHRHLIITH
jgi:N-methylhydantoinase A